MKVLGVSYVRLGGPLFFSMEKVKKFGIPVRAIPNIASEWPWPGDNGITGTWIRPEDVELYSNYVDAMEFENCNLQQDRGFFRIYAEQQAWPGDMTMIISNLHTDALNRLVHPSLAETRLNCGQRCQETGRCRYCERMLMMSTEKFVRQAAATLDLQS